MKTLILILALFSFNSLACKNLIPESEAQRYIAAAPEGIPGLYSCKDKPDEPCLCFDGVDWRAAQLVDNIVPDLILKVNMVECVDQTDCDAKFIEVACPANTDKIKNYDLLQVYCAEQTFKIDGKKLANDPVKAAALEAAQAVKVEQESTRKSRRVQARVALKNANLGTVTTIAAVKVVLAEIIELLKEE